MSSPVAIDLFCGVGGLSTGLKEAGFRIAAGVDIDPIVEKPYKLNHPNAVFFDKNVASIPGSELISAAGTSDITLLAGGPACQGFSTHGKRKEDDPRNFLFKEFVRLVREIRPRFFLLENVKGLLAYGNGHFREAIGSAFEQLGYSVTNKVLHAEDFGVPQRRHRVFFLGTRLDVQLSMPTPTHGPQDQIRALRPFVSVGDAISDLPLMNGEFDREVWEYETEPTTSFQRYARRYMRTQEVKLHQANEPTERAMEVVRLVKEGQGLRSLPVEKLPERFLKMRRISNGDLRKDCTTLYHRLARSEPAYTITCYFRNVSSGPFLHPLENRSLSFREAARLMSFRDNFRLGSVAIARQIGNAVPPLLAKAVGRHILSLEKTKAPA